MCQRCRTVVLRETGLSKLAVLLDDPRACERFRRAADAEIMERMAAGDLDDPADEQL